MTYELTALTPDADAALDEFAEQYPDFPRALASSDRARHGLERRLNVRELIRREGSHPEHLPDRYFSASAFLRSLSLARATRVGGCTI